MQSVSPGFELVSPCPFPTTVTITLRATHGKYTNTFWKYIFCTTILARVDRGVDLQNRCLSICYTLMSHPVKSQGILCQWRWWYRVEWVYRVSAVRNVTQWPPCSILWTADVSNIWGDLQLTWHSKVRNLRVRWKLWVTLGRSFSSSVKIRLGDWCHVFREILKVSQAVA